MATRSTERYIGTATLRRDFYAGRITVEQADDVIGVTPDLWDNCEPWMRPDGQTLVLDTAGEYRYRLTGETSESDEKWHRERKADEARYLRDIGWTDLNAPEESA